MAAQPGQKNQTHAELASKGIKNMIWGGSAFVIAGVIAVLTWDDNAREPSKVFLIAGSTAVIAVIQTLRGLFGWLKHRGKV